MLKAGTKDYPLPEVYVIFITENDVLKGGLGVYRIFVRPVKVYLLVFSAFTVRYIYKDIYNMYAPFPCHKG